MDMKKTISGFIPTELPKSIDVDEIITIHYFEYPKDFFFKGESHEFWEFLYVDKGEVTVSTDDDEYHLKQGQIIFHRPNEFHNVICNGAIAPNLVVVSFTSSSSRINFFDHKILDVCNRAKSLLNIILYEARLCFETDLSDPYCKGLVLSENFDGESLSLIRASLEAFLIQLIRQESDDKVNFTSSIHDKENKSRIDFVSSYLKENVENNLTLDMVCSDCGIGKSAIQKIFKEQKGWSIMEYYYRLKIDRAKLLIKEGNMNFSSISQVLGYSSVHYFSRQFKKIVGMSPREYSKTIDSYKD